YKFMRKASYKLQNRRSAKMNGDVAAQGRTVIYMNRDMIEALDGLGTNSGNGALMIRPMELEGKEVMSYRGLPIRETDALINAEALVS
ncbi:MAG: phage major capsid protein, partial [Sphingomonas sp.]